MFTNFAQEQSGLFQNINYKGTSTAAWEVTIMLVGAYLLGILTYWLIHRYLHAYAERVLMSQATEKDAGPAEEDLTIIEGIGPKIETVLQSNGVKNYRTLAVARPKELKVMLEEAGNRFAVHDPTSWPKQARLAAAGHFDELEDLKDRLVAGK